MSMSDTLSQDPETGLSSGYTLAASYPAAATSTSDAPVVTNNLPPFSTFAAEMDGSGGGAGYGFGESRLLEIPQWEYYPDTRLVEARSENGALHLVPQYRPWESKIDAGHHVTPFPDAAFAAGSGSLSKLPSFQSQFHAFSESLPAAAVAAAAAAAGEQPTTLTTLTTVAPSGASPPNLTALGAVGNFHALNARNYPLVPAPIQAREIPSIQQQFLDERHIQLYTHPPTTFPAQNGALQIQNIGGATPTTVVTVLKTEPDLKLTLHPAQFQNPMAGHVVDNGGGVAMFDKKMNGMGAHAGSPTRSDFRKKERRKIRASSLESSAESDGASSNNMEIGSENSGQVAAVSSTAGFKHHAIGVNVMDVDDLHGANGDKQVKKKRKRCGECIGCQRKDNCGDCAPCRNDKSHQICKQRRCEKLTEKKNLYGDPSFTRSESRRGRGKGRGGASYRGRKGNATTAINNSANETTGTVVTASRPSPQPTAHLIKQEQPVQQPQQQQQQHVQPPQQQAMASMPFYADPNRFTTPVWQTDPSAAPQEIVPAWPQGQFIQQIAPAQPQATLEAYPAQQYTNGIYQATYQQPAFEANAFYTGAVQVLTSARPPSVPTQLTPRTNGSYTPSPSPVTPSQSQQQQQQQQAQPQGTGQAPPQSQANNAQRANMNAYEYIQNYAQPPATPPNDSQVVVQSQSRPNSVNGSVPSTVASQTTYQTNGFTSVSSTSFSPNSAATAPNYVNAASGNERPGYPQVNSNPQLVSHSSSGYPGTFGGNPSAADWATDGGHVMWEQTAQQQQDQINESAKQQSADNSNQYENENNHHDPGDHFNPAHRVNINSRIKTMILNKQQQQEKKLDDGVPKDEHKQQQTGHFLWYSHHRHLRDTGSDGGGFMSHLRHSASIQQRTQHQFDHLYGEKWGETKRCSITKSVVHIIVIGHQTEDSHPSSAYIMVVIMITERFWVKQEVMGKTVEDEHVLPLYAIDEILFIKLLTTKVTRE